MVKKWLHRHKVKSLTVNMLCVYHGRFVWPRDLCYVRYWRRNDDGSYGRLIAFLLKKLCICLQVLLMRALRALVKEIKI